MKNNLTNPDAPDPNVTAMMLEQLKQGLSDYPYTSPPGYPTEPYYYPTEQPMWTTSLDFCNMPYSGDTITPQKLLEKCGFDKFKPRKIYRDEYTDIITVRERNGREIAVGDFKIKAPFIVNPKGNEEFDVFCCTINENGKDHPVKIPYKDFVKRNILRYLSFLLRNPDCPDKYIVDAFYMELYRSSDLKFLNTPERTGWSESKDNNIQFASNLSVLPNLEDYYPLDIRERKLIRTNRSLVDIAREYVVILPEIWQLKLLIAIRIASMLLYFFKKEGISPDQLFVVEPANESAAKAIIALIKNKNYDSQTVLSLTATKTELNASLNKTNDGTVVIRDSSYAEEWKRRENGVKVLLDDLHGSNDNENSSRHLITIVSDNPSNLQAEIPAMYINIADKVCIGDPNRLHQLSGEFDSAFINTIIKDSTNMQCLIESAIRCAKFESETIRNSENVNAKRLIRGGLRIMNEYNLISDEESKEIYSWLKNGCESNTDSSTAIVNDFRTVFNRLLFSSIKIAPQYGPPYYEVGNLWPLRIKVI